MSESLLYKADTEVIDVIWHVVAPMIEPALEYADGKYAIEDVREMLVTDRAQLWLSMRGETIEACCVTQVWEFPRKKVCGLLFIGGKQGRNWFYMNDIIAQWAKSIGCANLEGYCRKGWIGLMNKGVIQGWTPTFTYVTKRI